MSKEIKAIAATILASNPSFDAIHMTTDGQGFSKKETAEAHQGRLNANEKVLTFSREGKTSDATEDPSILSLSVSKLAEALKEVEDIESLEAFLAEEQLAENPRKGALKAIAERIEEIKLKNIDVNL